MKAIIVESPGGADQLKMGEFPTPQPTAKELLVKVKATALNRADIFQREGKYPPPKGESPLLGLEMAGVVEQAGNACHTYQVGDRVSALLPSGGYAEYVVVPEALAIPIPENLSFEQAVAIPEVFLTAYQALFWIGNLQQDETVLIHAGASGVGTAAIQLAKIAGATVIITAGTDQKVEYCRQLGAAHGINYKQDDFAENVLIFTENKGVDMIIDFVGASYWQQNISAIALDGRWVILATLGGAKIEQVNLRKLFAKRVQLTCSTLRSRELAYKIDLTQEFAYHHLPHFATGELQPVVDRVFSWYDVVAAHRYMEANQNIGKIVLTI